MKPNMKIKKLFLALTILLISTSPVWAENWVPLAESNQGEAFVDADSIRKAGGFVYFWQIVNYTEPTKYQTLSVKAYIKVNCNSLGYMSLKSEYYDSHMGKGKLNSSGNPKQVWIYDPPNSAGNIIMREVCSYSQKIN